MKIFLDSADVEKIKELAKTKLVDGITTNPTLILKAGMEQEKAIKQICSIIDGPVSVEGIAQTSQEMIKDGINFSKWAKNVVVKIPMGKEGLIAVRELKKLKIKTNVTLVFSPTQALLAAKAGADYVSPFVGRLDDISEDGTKLVQDILTIYKNYNFSTEVIVASIRHPMHVINAAKIGAHICTIPPEIFEKLFLHPLTDKGNQLFLEDYKKALEKFSSSK
ncbi:MAG: fructose-6-phosphate aldolase [Candidatus Anstonellaceae archaeon]